jgi:multiple sugar transport system substrate-binding protein
MLKGRVAVSVCIAVTAMLAGCSQSGSKPANVEKAAVQEPAFDVTKPVTLNFMMSGSKDNFIQKFQKSEKLKEKLPNVTLEYLSINDWDKIILSGVMPDVINLVPQNFYKVVENGLTYDHTALLKKYNINTARFIPEYLEVAKKLSGTNGLNVIPDKMDFPYNPYTLAYNKAIFDKLAIPYPKDNMTWQEAIELAKKFNGSEFKGLTIQAGAIRKQKNLEFLNSQGKVDLSDKGWAESYEIAKTAAAVQDNWPDATTGNLNAFTKDQKVAMFAGNINNIILQAQQLEGILDWDMVTLPRFPGDPVILPSSSGFFAITSKSENKDLTMAVLSILLEENVDRLNYESPAVKKRNINAMKDRKVSLDAPSRYEPTLNSKYVAKIQDMVTKNKDVNTALREAQEEMQIALDQEKVK